MPSLSLSASLSPHEPAAGPPCGASRLPPLQPQLHEHGPADPGRAAVEAFIRGVFRERYRADVRQFAPVLVGLRDADGALVAAAGFRAADAGPLFLERYLDVPVESLLPGEACGRPRRERIVEVAHLAAVRAGAGRCLIGLLGLHLAARGFEWAVSTLTEELRLLFLRLGIAPLALGVADPAVLGDEAAHWGSYYDHRPVVLAGQLQQALQSLAHRGSLR